MPSALEIAFRRENPPNEPEEADFGWEDWWGVNATGLLASYEPMEGVGTQLHLTVADVPRLLSLYHYRGEFEEGLHSFVTTGLKSIEGAEGIVADIALGYRLVAPDEMIPSLCSPSSYRVLATRALGYLGGERAVDACVAQLDSATSGQLRHWACLSLGRLNAADHLELLANVARTDSSQTVRAAACQAIAQIGGHSAESILMELASGRDPARVVAAAVTSLGFMGPQGIGKAAEAAISSSNREVRIAAAFAYAQCSRTLASNGKCHSGQFRSYLSALLGEKDSECRGTMALALLLVADSSVLEGITPLLTHPDSQLRSIAALAVGSCGALSAVELIACLPLDTVPAVEIARAYALAFLAGGEPEKLVADLVNSESDCLSAAGVILMLRRRSGLVIDLPGFVSGLRRGALVQRAVTYALAVSSAPSAVEETAMNALCNEPERYALALIGTAVRAQGAGEAENIPGNRPAEAGTELQLCLDLASEVAGVKRFDRILGLALRDGHPGIRSAGAMAVGISGRDAQLECLLSNMMHDRDDWARSHAISALAGIEVPEGQQRRVVELLVLLMLAGRHWRASQFAAMALSRFSHIRYAEDSLLCAVNSSLDSRVRWAAAVGLGLLGSRRAGDVAELVRSDFRSFGGPGVISLGLMRERCFLDTVIRDLAALEQTSDSGAYAFYIARSAGPDTWTGLLEYADDDDGYLREYAVRSLAMMTELSDTARATICKKLESREHDDDAVVRFYAGVTRVALGDYAGFRCLLEAASSEKFSLTAGMDGSKGLQTLLNSRYPLFYRVPALTLWQLEAMREELH